MIVHRRIAFLLLALTLSGSRAAQGGEEDVAAVVVSLIAEVEVAALEAGPLVELAVAEGRRVKSGDVLGRLDDRDANLQVERAQIELRHATEQAKSKVKLQLAEETLKLAQLELERATTANQELARVVSPSQLSKLQLEVRRAELDVQQAQEDLAAAARSVEAAANELAIAQRALARRQILAPMDGVVVDVRRHVGEWLEPGKFVVRLVRDDRLRATGFVGLDQLRYPLEGQTATLRVALSSHEEAAFTGRVTFVSPEANPINRQVKLIAEFDNLEGRLRAGLPAKMTIHVDSDSPTP
ncbi:MAG: efflux RND transporter periplasmic adaptor subunit [Pirellulaceae bacterium]|jgi:macrolide-specific efflux system membrane fusion protein|nr:efflux RND transporter periplasmic adaptor subunit [Pirellulaceae bacterium]